MATAASFAAPPAVAAGGLRFAAGYVRRSDPRKQRDNHSAEVQRAAIEQLAGQLGCVVTMWEQEEIKGRRIDRSGYQRILEAARRHEIHVILVFSLSRWGRRPLERVTRGEDLDRLGVELWSAQQGRDKPGFMRYGYAGMDEQAVRDLAANVRPARRRAAESGVHMGPTPQLGYRRHYPAWDGDGKRPAGELVVDEATAWVVRELYARYEGLSGVSGHGGNESCLSLARWMNADPRVPKPRDAATWGDYHVRAVLRSVLYKGYISYDKLPQGYYERAAPGDAIVRPGKHAAIVADDVWRRVQERMDTAGRRPTRARVRHAYLGAGLLVCAGCGAPLRPHVAATVVGHKGSYLCRTARANGGCAAPGYRLDLAHEALLTELGRLRGAPWTTRGEERLQGGGVRAAAATRLKREIAAERAALRDQAEALAAMRGATKGGGIPGEAVRAFLALSETAEARIAGLEAQRGLAERAGPPLEDLRSLWAEVHQTDTRAIVVELGVSGKPADAEPLRALLLLVVESAQLVERRPATHSRWLRVEVTWTEGVRELLRAGMLTLDLAPEPPVLPTPLELRTAAQRRWRERKGQETVS
jgi:DNA invertase Pin-like site-specific DNA recombinase